MQGGVNAQTTQVAKIYSGTISEGDTLLVTDSNGNQILSQESPKAAGYIYFNHASAFTFKLNGNEQTLSDPTQNQQSGGQQGGPQDGPINSDGMGPPPSDMNGPGDRPSDMNGPGNPPSDMNGPGNPSSELNHLAALLPISSPFCMPLRIMMGAANNSEILLSIGILIITIIVVANIAIKIYRNAILNYGKSGLKDLLKMYKQK